MTHGGERARREGADHSPRGSRDAQARHGTPSVHQDGTERYVDHEAEPHGQRRRSHVAGPTHDAGRGVEEPDDEGAAEDDARVREGGVDHRRVPFAHDAIERSSDTSSSSVNRAAIVRPTTKAWAANARASASEPLPIARATVEAIALPKPPAATVCINMKIGKTSEIPAKAAGLRRPTNTASTVTSTIVATMVTAFGAA